MQDYWQSLLLSFNVHIIMLSKQTYIVLYLEVNALLQRFHLRPR